jgi:phosphoribosylformylglycinamidine synthase subunit PurL
MGQFVGCIEGMREACNALEYPVVSGNVSLYNETNGTGIFPTPAIGGVGLLEKSEHMTTVAFKAADETILVVGDTFGDFGQSIYLRTIEDREEGAPPAVDLVAEKRNGDFVRNAIHSGLVTACHDISDGGLAVAVSEMALAGNIGANLELGDSLPLHAACFAEDQARYIVTASANDAEKLAELAKSANVPLQIVGTTGHNDINIGKSVSVSLNDIRQAHTNWLPDLMTVPGN